ncbi:hypothetical protein AAF712_015871 [Marasmius tenuissimus]|uniref:DUF6532 domain-containing protein n=1 Tax=Marasmius tenuissimus TaxID=585030 RepID=A0ABR2Z8C5_9AGAR
MQVIIGTKHSADKLSNEEVHNDEGCKLGSRNIAKIPIARQRVVAEAYAFFCKAITQTDCFPASDNLEYMRTGAWHNALVYLQNTKGLTGVSPMPLKNELNLIQQCLSQFRGNVKTAARNAVVVRTAKEKDGGMGYSAAGFYFIKSDVGNVNVQNQNSRLCELLIEKCAFVYQNPFDTSAKGSLFRNETIQIIINKVFFDDGGESEGLRQGFFEDEAIPLPAIALVVTAYECALDEWKTGVHTPISFAAARYEAKYHQHLKTLQDWHIYSQTPTQACQTLQKDLYWAGSVYVGAINPDGNLSLPMPTLSASAFAVDE